MIYILRQNILNTGCCLLFVRPSRAAVGLRLQRIAQVTCIVVRCRNREKCTTRPVSPTLLGVMWLLQWFTVLRYTRETIRWELDLVNELFVYNQIRLFTLSRKRCVPAMIGRSKQNLNLNFAISITVSKFRHGSREFVYPEGQNLNQPAAECRAF